MKINEIEKLLGVTKANIRFYEKEGLLTPGRSANGYRDYSDADVARLKEIVILRKLGIPVQQIADILDGALPLQEAVQSNIQVLEEEIKKLNGSLSLCKQISRENLPELDTDRYWNIIQEQEQQGNRFLDLLADYRGFMWPILRNKVLYTPESEMTKRKKIFYYITGFLSSGALWTAIDSVRPHSFTHLFRVLIAYTLITLALTGLYLLLCQPFFLIHRKSPDKARKAVSILDYVFHCSCALAALAYTVHYLYTLIVIENVPLY